MQGMTPLELKYHLKEIERSFARSQTPAPAANGRQNAGHGWKVTLMTWLKRPSAAALKPIGD